MTLQQCRYLVEIAARRSIRQAAEALYVTQPSISKAVKELERELGITILERTSQGVTFTPDGQELLFMAQLLIAQSESISHHFSRGREARQAQEFSISSQHYCCIPRVLAEFSAQWDRYAVFIREGRSTDVVEDVAASRSILGFLSFNPRTAPYFERVFQQRELEFQELAAVSEHVYVRRGHPLAGLPAIPPEALADYPCLTYRLDDVPLGLGEPPSLSGRVFYLTDRGTLRDLQALTDGYCLGTGILEPGDPLLTAVPLEGGLPIRVGCIRRQQTFLSEPLETFIRLAGSALRDASGT